MVSKVAVVALVAILACPILIGYGMNLDEQTVTKFEPSKETIDVSQMLHTGTDYTYAHADLLDMNTKVIFDNNLIVPPEFDRASSARTSLPLTQDKYYNSSVHPGNPQNLSNYTYYAYLANYDPTLGYLSITVTFDDGNSTWTDTYDKIYALYFDYTDNTLYYKRYITQNGEQYISNTTYELPYAKTVQYTHTGTYIADTCITYNNKNIAPKYVDISAGFRLNRFTFEDSPSPKNITNLNLPDNPRYVLLTLDLYTIIDPNYDFKIGIDNKWIRLTKTTTAGLGEQWAVYWDIPGNTDKIADLYYDATRDSNAYQLYIDQNGIEFRYVGAWPSLIGAANSYISYSAEWPIDEEINLGNIGFRYDSPLMRVDDAYYRAFEYLVIENVKYQPGYFKHNPSTTLSNITQYGTSLTFGGVTYTVNKGNITMGTHQISLRNAVLQSTETSGGYENRINGYLVSTTATPGDITFTGKWSATIMTDSLASVTTTKTEWTPGQFAWDGIDQNFLMIGLLAAVGAFIGLGIAYRRAKSALFALLVVCGGAAVLFFTML